VVGSPLVVGSTSPESSVDVRELRTDQEIIAAYPLARQLRDRIREETFLAEVRRQESQGYRLFG